MVTLELKNEEDHRQYVVKWFYVLKDGQRITETNDDESETWDVIKGIQVSKHESCCVIKAEEELLEDMKYKYGDKE